MYHLPSVSTFLLNFCCCLLNTRKKSQNSYLKKKESTSELKVNLLSFPRAFNCTACPLSAVGICSVVMENMEDSFITEQSYYISIIYRFNMNLLSCRWCYSSHCGPWSLYLCSQPLPLRLWSLYHQHLGV